MDEIDNLLNDRAALERLLQENADLQKRLNDAFDREEFASGETTRSSNLIQELADVSVQGIIVLGEKNIEFCNARARQLNGVPESVLSVGKPWLDFFLYQFERGDFGEGEEAQDFFDALIANFEKREIMQIERKAGDGRTIRADRIPNSIGGMTLTLTDITELKTREAELEESMAAAKSAERAKSDFLANMSHEIRTPMNGVMGMAELLAETELTAKQKMFTDVIVKSGASLLTIINDVLDFSKLDAKQMELDPAPFILAEAIEDVATLMSAKVAEKDLELIVRVDPSLPKMMVGDVGRLRQVVTNMMGNAVKFTEKGHVYVNVEGDVEQTNSGGLARLKFEIRDTGIGIPEELRQKVFEKFSQVDTSATRKHEGTGLGLSITSSLIELMDGEIGVESEVGVGSNFWFTVELPVHSQAIQPKIIPGDLTGAKILIIDDNPVNRSILSEQMAAWRFDSAACGSGSEGLEFLHAAVSNGVSVDLLILDYQMPEMSGADVLRQIRKNKVLNNIPIIMLSSVDSGKTNQELKALGAEVNLSKPTRSSLLLETVISTIAKNRASSRVGALTQGTTEIEEIEEIEERPTSAIASDPKQLDVLIAEDNEVNQVVFRQILEKSGLNYKIANNGRLAFANYKIQAPRLVLMDVSMPEMNGKEATLAIRAYEQENNLAETPIVGVTAHALKGDMEACLDAGMDDYLSKPVSPAQLISKIEQWLKVETGMQTVR